MTLNFRKMFTHSPEDYKALDRLIGVVDKFKNDEIDKHQNDYLEAESTRIKCEDEDLLDGYLDHISEEICFIDRVGSLAKELSTLALHKKLELTTNEIMKHYFPKTNIKNLYQIANVVKLLDINGIDIESIKNYSSANELRLISNAIKHQGHVTEKLGALPGWTKGERLIGLQDVYNRIRPEIPEYLIDIDEKLSKKSILKTK